MLHTNPQFTYSFANLGKDFGVPTKQQSLVDTKYFYLNHTLAQHMDLPSGWLGSESSLDFFSGRQANPNAVAMAYTGHQFGHFAPALGDGRALLVGEFCNRQGELFDLHLKGSGRTIFSRMGDGKATLGAVIREVLVGNAMAALGIPTSQALAAIITAETIYRDTQVPSAILVRVARGHLRVGSFQYFAARGMQQQLSILVDYAIKRWYPTLAGAANPSLELLQIVVTRQAKLVAQWMQVGFIHGVMNTDNTGISAETFDYGPCAFMDVFRHQQVFSSIDTQGRYAWHNQPRIIQWNLCRFAEALLPLLNTDQQQAIALAQQAIESFVPQYKQYWLDALRSKLGFSTTEPADEQLGERLLAAMEQNKLDYTNSWRGLAGLIETDDAHPQLAAKLQDWLADWRDRIQRESIAPSVRKQQMHAVNPAVIPRNHLVNQVIHSAEQEGNMQPFYDLLKQIEDPYTERDSIYTRQPLAHQEVKQTFCGT